MTDAKKEDMFDSLTAPLDRRVEDKPSLIRSTVQPLSDEELLKALPVLNRDGHLETFQRIDRRYADPELQHQKIVLVSFVPSRGATPDKDEIYGMMKVRGVFATEEEANERAEFLIRHTDSLHEIYHAYVGRPFPVTTKTGYEKELQTIDIRKKTVDLISEDLLSKKRKEKQEMEELQEKEKRLLEESDRALRNEPSDPYETYITNQVKRAQLLWTWHETKKKITQMKDSFYKARDAILEAELAHPEYVDQYKEKYMKARRDAGIPDDDHSFLQYLGLDLPWDE